MSGNSQDYLILLSLSCCRQLHSFSVIARATKDQETYARRLPVKFKNVPDLAWLKKVYSEFIL